MYPSRTSAALFVMAAGAAVVLRPQPASAGKAVACPPGFSKILEHDKEAVCRRSQSVASADLGEAVANLWHEAHCNGTESDRQTSTSQAPSGAWTVTMRFFCLGF